MHQWRGGVQRRRRVGIFSRKRNTRTVAWHPSMEIPSRPATAPRLACPLVNHMFPRYLAEIPTNTRLPASSPHTSAQLHPPLKIQFHLSGQYRAMGRRNGRANSSVDPEKNGRAAQLISEEQAAVESPENKIHLPSALRGGFGMNSDEFRKPPSE